ncbi:hypothetical protein [Altererythrobacter litoralis]|uniref:Uncharacterized protein n=1 Tax=Altererythrobacter litoralis TaxID=3113904 RepID=A0ABU7GGQ5_9SPHN|nr:hypothetical protein [Erythrobacteraceae bacterium 1XM1-14]
MPTADACARGEQGFPYIVIRLAAAVYQCERLSLSNGSPSARIAHKNSQLIHPGVDEATGALDADARRFLEVTALNAVQKFGFRMSVIYAADDCVFLEPDGSINRSKEPPSGGLSLTVEFGSPPQRDTC